MEILELILNMGWVAGLCFIIGMILVIIEMFYPGFGVPGITGSILLVLGIILTVKTPFQALIIFVILLSILGVVLAIVLHSAAKGNISKKLVLFDSLNNLSSYTNIENLEYLLENEGTTLTVLKPTGFADFNGVKRDVISEGDFIPKNVRIKVVNIDGRKIIVRQIK